MSQVGGYSAIDLANGGKKMQGDVVTATPAQPAPLTPTPMDAAEFSDSMPAPGTERKSIPTPMDANEFSDAVAAGFGSIAKFPADLDTRQPTWMEIQSYKRTGVSIGSKMAEADFVPTAVEGTEMVCLPIPSGVGTNYGHSWDQSDVSISDQFVLQDGGNDQPGMGLGRKLNVAASNLMGDTGAMSEAVSEQKSMGAISGVLAGITKGAAGAVGLIAAGQVFPGASQQATGKAAFTEQVVHYSGPAFRQFEFTFSLKPITPTDQLNIGNIVKFLKVGSMPDLLASGIGRVYELPLFFRIRFMGQNGELKHMNKIAFCALTGFNVKYGGDRFQTFAANDAPVQTDISMTFKEISLLNKQAVIEGY